MPDMPFGIPEEMRRFAERGIEEARKAFGAYVEAAQNAFAGVEKSARSSEASLADLNRQAIAYAENNVQATFEFLGRLSRAGTVESMVEIQQDFFRKQAEAATAQAEELTRSFAGGAGRGR